MKPLLRLRCAALLAALLLVPPAAAQSFLHPVAPGTDLTLEWTRPSFEEGDGLAFFTSSALLTGRVAVTPRFVLVASLPVSHVAYDLEGVGFEPEGSTDLGNPYVGFQFYTPGATRRFGVGVHLPLADEESEAGFVGQMADFDRFEAYAPEFATVSVEAFAARRADALRLEGGLRPAFLIHTGEHDVDPEFYLHYEGRAWYVPGALEIGVGLSGIALVSESELAFEERTIHQAALYVAGNLGRVRPGAYVRVPLDDDLSDLLSYVLGLGVAVTLPR